MPILLGGPRRSKTIDKGNKLKMQKYGEVWSKRWLVGVEWDSTHDKQSLCNEMMKKTDRMGSSPM